MDADNESKGAVVRGMRSTVGRESTTFGFSILATAMFGLLQVSQGPPDTARVFLFATGAVLSFTLLEGALSKGFRRPMPQHHTQVLALGTSMNLLSVLGGLGTAWALAAAVSHAMAWAVAPFAGAIVYLAMESAETALAERVLVRSGDGEARETSS